MNSQNSGSRRGQSQNDNSQKHERTVYVRDILQDYKRTWLDHESRCTLDFAPEEGSIYNSFISFLKNQDFSWFERDCQHGHFTGSGLVTTPNLDQVLLTHHRKLNLWLQLGGHADGIPRLDEVAMQETREESGLNSIVIDSCPELSPWKRVPGFNYPFDLDRHLIPARRDEPKHYHYDVRFLVIADPNKAITVSEESYDVRWFSLEEAYKITSERSMHRQFEKLALVAKKRGVYRSI